MLTWWNTSLVRAFRHVSPENFVSCQFSVVEFPGWPVWHLESKLGGMASVIFGLIFSMPSGLSRSNQYPVLFNLFSLTDFMVKIKRMAWRVPEASLRSIFPRATSSVQICLWRWRLVDTSKPCKKHWKTLNEATFCSFPSFFWCRIRNVKGFCWLKQKMSWFEQQVKALVDLW